MSETTDRAELIPEYSAEQIADNYPVRKVEMLSGPYMPAYRARARFEADAAHIAENEETIEQLSENLKIAARAHGVLEAEIARLKALLQRLADWDSNPLQGSDAQAQAITRLIELLPIVGAVKHELSLLDGTKS